MLDLAQNLQLLHKQRKPFVLVTLVNIKGSAPQVEGAKMLVTCDGLFWGTVGGGKIEAHSIQYAQDLLSESKSAHSQTWNLQKDIGMSCGGEVTMFFDVNQSLKWRVAIFGAGHVAQELCRVLTTWSCQVSVFDTRAEWLERLPSSDNIDKKLCVNMSEEVAALPAGTFLLTITHGHDADLPILVAAFKRASDFSFIGVIGSTIKANKIKISLLEAGAAKEQVNKLVCPMGLPIGNSTPSEIAISIGAQLLAVRDAKNFSVAGGLC